jgi:hypothetical protein
MSILTVLMGLAGIAGLIVLFLAGAGAISLTTPTLVFIGVITIVNLLTVAVEAGSQG